MTPDDVMVLIIVAACLYVLLECWSPMRVITHEPHSWTPHSARDMWKGRIRSRKQGPPGGYGQAIKIERAKARAATYTAASDFTHLMLMADIMRTEDKNSRAAQMLETAASAVKRSNIAAWLACRAAKYPVNRPRRW